MKREFTIVSCLVLFQNKYTWRCRVIINHVSNLDFILSWKDHSPHVKKYVESEHWSIHLGQECQHRLAMALQSLKLRSFISPFTCKPLTEVARDWTENLLCVEHVAYHGAKITPWQQPHKSYKYPPHHIYKEIKHNGNLCNQNANSSFAFVKKLRFHHMIFFFSLEELKLLMFLLGRNPCGTLQITGIIWRRYYWWPLWPIKDFKWRTISITSPFDILTESASFYKP